MRAAFLIAAATVATFVITASADEPTIAPTEFRSPADELKALHLPPGFEAELVAAEPDINKPINLAFDAKGRLWATCTIEYPFPAAEGKGRDTVKILEDFGPDGRARKVTTFADGLNIPIGVLPRKDGAIVYSIPNLWWLRDTSGKWEKCNDRKVLVSGFGHRDTHGMINGLTLGFDGWVYCNHGYSNTSNATGTDGSVVHLNSGNVFRMHPNGMHVEMFCKGQVNPFGHCMDEYGNHYTSDCHSRAITQLMRGAVYSSFAKPHDGLGFGPDMVHAYRGATAIDGACYYGADQFPEYYRGGLFIGEVVNNRVNFFTLNRSGATYTATQQADFITSDDAWFRPVDIKLGPDGAIYIADFYNRIIGHYEVPLTHPGRDRTSGRIWRIVYKGADGKAPPPTIPTSYWIKDLSSPNLTVRMLATNRVVELGEAGLCGQEAKGLEDDIKALFKPGAPPTGRAHALWIWERVQGLDDATLLAAAKDKELLVRAHALRILAEREKLTDDQRALLREAVRNADDGLVRRFAAEALGRHPSAEARQALLDAISTSRGADDPFLQHALRIALREQFRGQADWGAITPRQIVPVGDIALGLPEPGAAAFLANKLQALSYGRVDRVPDFVHHIARYGTPECITTVVNSKTLSSLDGRADAAVLLALLRGLQERGATPPLAVVGVARDTCSRLLGSAKPEDIQAGIELAAALKQPLMRGNVLRILVDRQHPEAVRIAALNGLAAFDPKPSVGAVGLRLNDSTETIEFREKAANWLAAVNTSDARAALLAALQTAPARLATTIAAGLASTPDGASALLDTIAAGKASPRVLQERAAEVKLVALKRPDLAARVKALTAGLPPADEQLAKLLRQRAHDFAKATPDAAAGAKVFEKHCAACHQIAGKGMKVGPQLDGIGVRGLDRLLEDVLDPNRNVDQAFRATTLTLKTGQSLTGLVLREEGAVIVLADAQGKEQRVAAEQVAERAVSLLSPMPANWADQIPENDFHDLMAYLLRQK
jgi:putative heme-binding domain-containing protein